MDIEYLRLEALKLAVGSHGSILPPEKIVEAAGRYADFLVGKAGPATFDPLRTLESEGQKWDEEARQKSVANSTSVNAKVIASFPIHGETWPEHHGC